MGDRVEGLNINFDNIPKEILDLIAYNNFEEGDDYYPIERLRGGFEISQSCWDDQSEELPFDNNFRYLKDALKFAKAIGVEKVIVEMTARVEFYRTEIDLINRTYKRLL